MIRVAVDGGQSALRLRVLGGRTGTGPGYKHSSNSVQNMLDAISAAASEAQIAEPVEVAALGLTGFPADPPTAQQLAEGIAETLLAKEVRLTQDMVTAHAGALPDGYGVVVAAGTGLVCLAVDGTGPGTRSMGTDTCSAMPGVPSRSAGRGSSQYSGPGTAAGRRRSWRQRLSTR